MDSDSMWISDTEILPGETKKVTVNIARLPSHSPIEISITVARSKIPGPVFLMMGGMHGDEINGIEIVRRIIQNNLHIPERGTTISIPIINVYGFIHFSRYVPDGKDVNRSFPGNKNGSLAARVAYYLMKEIIPKIDYGIDFHTGGADRTNYPQIRCMMSDPVNAELAAAFAAPFSLHSAFRPKSLRWAAGKMKKKILVYEGGESSRFDEYAISQGILGTERLMNHLGLKTYAPPATEHETILIKSSSWIRAKASGLFGTLVSSGQTITKNQIVGYISDPFGEFKVPVRAGAKGYVIGLNNNPIVHQGDALMHIGVLKG
ncbi:succinylglutamate desuccinylase/aspartoacylase family protein [Reichenbachiella agarivorans]|uniref:Succinylglutamate desuccinylase/aspartoacylase family protein n=1 Tax=Reichenbachiella agarivorans TaxID=2979464 RepID=A0ABY6CTT3_9BACT|nr:succinylglutamate desuccinylase/aspartoacylase family protein [Reichenbachiella agarivorans]UXP33400.1 succinylglutamate desuccinylase/aspartoacylase family protein [Reichenbachiella agarivorans]